MSKECFKQQIPEKFSTIKELIGFLNDWHIPVETWGKGEAKTVGHLFEELRVGDSNLEIKGGCLIRIIKSAIIDVYYFNEEREKFLQLKELKQVFKDGRIRERHLAWSLSEKLEPRELALEGAIRCLAEELKIFPNQGFVNKGADENLQLAQSYPGLKTQYQNNRFSIYLTPEQYRPEGYIEEKDDITTYWGWERI